MTNFYIRTKEHAPTQGPFTPEQLRALAAKGKVKPHYLVSKDGHTWYVAANIHDLPVPPTAPPPAEPDQIVLTPLPDTKASAPASDPMPKVLLTGLVIVLLGVVGVTGYFLFIENDDGTGLDNEIPGLVGSPGPGPANPAPQTPNSPVEPPNPPTPPVEPPTPPVEPPTPVPPVGPVNPPVKPPVRPPVSPTPTPTPRPTGDFEPLRPDRSFEILSVTYGGQVTRAMGSQLTFGLTNRTGRAIRSFKGEIWIYAPDGEYLIALPVLIDQPLEPDATLTKRGVWTSVGGKLLGMLSTSKDQMKFRFAAETVTFDDGRTETIWAPPAEKPEG